jgi:hypothetical protein
VIPTICPACCQELPPGYPYDHVAIDQALAGRRLLHGDELAEAIRVAARRGLTHFGISRRLHVGYTTIDAALGLKPEPVDDAVKRLHAAGKDDYAIAIALNLGSRKAVQNARNRLGLPALYGPGGRKRTGVTA